jgi:glutathione synthase/RimK-type ligase-like ATP-grasp enzyme
MHIYPYKLDSESAKLLAEALGVKRIKKEGSKFKGSPEKVVINWGNSKVSVEVGKCKVINPPEAVSLAADKLKFFNAMVGKVSIPPFTTSKADALAAVQAGEVIIARTILNGNSGAGIVVVEKEEDLVDAPLYTKYVPKKQEYRVHVFSGEVVDVQRKARDKGVADELVNWKIRNHQNGFIFARGEDAVGVVPQDVLDQAIAAVKVCGLDFGAVDVIFNDKQRKAYVLEVNTAPGVTGTTLEGYVQRFKEVA